MSVPAPVERAEDKGVRPPEADGGHRCPRQRKPSQAAQPVAEATQASPPRVAPDRPAGSRAPEPFVPAEPAVPARPARPLAPARPGRRRRGRCGHRSPALTWPARAARRRTIDGARLLTTGAVAISVPDRWRESADLAGVDGLSFDEPISLESTDGDGTMRVGMLADEAEGRTLLPAAFRRYLGRGNIETDDAVRLGDVQAYRYTDLEFVGDRAAEPPSTPHPPARGSSRQRAPARRWPAATARRSPTPSG